MTKFKVGDRVKLAVADDYLRGYLGLPPGSEGEVVGPHSGVHPGAPLTMTLVKWGVLGTYRKLRV